MAQIKVYGTDSCPMTQGTMRHLRKLGVPFDYVDIENDRRARKWVLEQNGGKEKKPTLDIEGQILSEPSDDELDDVLAAAGMV